jgi:hypothetical protein
MKLLHTETTLSWPRVSTLLWDGDQLVDVTSGNRFGMDGSISKGRLLMSYPFDRAISIRRDSFWSAVYDNRGTKGILMKNGKIHRELNRSYYFAKRYDYPVTLTLGPNGSVVVVHCPNSFDTLEFEDAETGATLFTKKSDEMEFHSRLVASSNGRYLLDAGWFWHPLGGAWVCDLAGLLGTSSPPGPDVNFSFGAEIDSAAFLGDDDVIVTSTDEVCNEATPRSGIGPLRLGHYSLATRRWQSTVEIREATGMIMPWRDWVISFYKFPKAIEIATGRVVHEWKHLRSGEQVGCIELGDPPPPSIALDPNNGRFAVASTNEITAVTLATT